MPSIVLTGSSGFIYSHVARYFVQQGWDVTIADHFDWQGKARNIKDILPQVHLLIGDLATGTLAERCAEVEADYVVHAAAYTHVDDAIANPELFMLNNTIGTTRLLQSLWRQYAHSAYMPQKIVVVSTDEVYGSTPVDMRFDEQQPFYPSNAYAASKVGVEAITQSFYVTHKLPLVRVRPCNTYAPGQFPAKMIPKFVQQLLRGQPLTLYNDGYGARDWLHAMDHATAIEILLLHGVPGEAYNLGADEVHTDADMAERIIAILDDYGVFLSYGSKPKVTHVPGRPGHDRRYVMNSDKLRGLGWAPQCPFAEGLRETVLWNVEQQQWWDSDRIQVGESSCPQ